MSNEETVFTLIEDANMNVHWECNCNPPQTHAVTQTLERRCQCKRCGKTIDKFVDQINEENTE